jgi:hypothetical protein
MIREIERRTESASPETACFGPADEKVLEQLIAARLTAVRNDEIRRLIINLPPRSLKSLMASVAFPAWCLGHDASAQILCVSYAQDLSDKLARDCRSIMMSRWYRRIFPTRLAGHRPAVGEFVTTAQGYRLATSNGGVLTPGWDRAFAADGDPDLEYLAAPRSAIQVRT